MVGALAAQWGAVCPLSWEALKEGLTPLCPHLPGVGWAPDRT